MSAAPEAPTASAPPVSPLQGADPTESPRRRTPPPSPPPKPPAVNLSFRQFLVWACQRSGVPPRPTEAIVLILAEGYSNAAAGAEMGASTHKAAEYYRRAVERLCVQEWEDYELQLFAQAVERATMEEDVRAHARALLVALRNSQDPTPRAVQYDEIGRPVASRDPLVDLETAVRIVRATPAKALLLRR